MSEVRCCHWRGEERSADALQWAELARFQAPEPPPPPPGYLPFQVVVPKADAVLARAPKYSGVFDGARRALELQAVRCT